MLRSYLVIAVLYILLLPSNVYAGSRGIPVLAYHHVSYDSTPLAVTPEKFEEQMAYLMGEGFQTISPGDIVAYMNGKNVHLPAKPILITFDDGYANNYTYAFPIMKRYGFKGTIFVVGKNIGRDNRLSVAMLREMVSYGFDVGYHTMSHKPLKNKRPDELEWEVLGSRKQIESALGIPLRFFAYPGGLYDTPSYEMVEKGYDGGFSIIDGINIPDQGNVFLLKRIAVFRYTSFYEISRLLDGYEVAG